MRAGAIVPRREHNIKDQSSETEERERGSADREEDRGRGRRERGLPNQEEVLDNQSRPRDVINDILVSEEMEVSCVSIL
jgi:hypothetical protein